MGKCTQDPTDTQQSRGWTFSWQAIVDVLDGDLIHAKRQRDDAREMWPSRLETEGNIYFTGLRGVQMMQMKPPNKQEFHTGTLMPVCRDRDMKTAVCDDEPWHAAESLGSRVTVEVLRAASTQRHCLKQCALA